MRWIVMTALLLTGCCHRFTTCPPCNPVKWSAESGLSTSVFPNAPCKGHEYAIDRVDISLKLRREW